MKEAPALAAQTACAAEKQSVTFTLIPSSSRMRVASKPAVVSGHFDHDVRRDLHVFAPLLQHLVAIVAGRFG